MGKFAIAIVIPAYNEEATIASVVKSVLPYGQAIVVNDGSSDATAYCAEDAGATVVTHRINRGYDEALNSGFFAANQSQYDAVITFDADGQHSVEMLEHYVAALTSGVEVVLGVRERSARLSEWLFRRYTCYRLGWKDPLCGMKGYRLSVYRQRGYFDSCHSIGTELAMYALVKGCRFLQLDVPVSKRKDNPRFASTFRANVLILSALYKIHIRYGQGNF